MSGNDMCLPYLGIPQNLSKDIMDMKRTRSTLFKNIDPPPTRTTENVLVKRKETPVTNKCFKFSASFKQKVYNLEFASVIRGYPIYTKDLDRFQENLQME